MQKLDLAPDFVFSPQPMYCIGTKDEDGSPHFCVITWIGFSLDKTPHLMMTMGGSKRTKTNILREGLFSANLVGEDMVWLADYFGTTTAEEKRSQPMPFDFTWGTKLKVPVLEQSRWVYECEVDRTIELDGSHLFLAEIRNIRIDQSLSDMNLEKIELERLKPVIYSPYRYYTAGGLMGECGEWKGRL